LQLSNPATIASTWNVKSLTYVYPASFGVGGSDNKTFYISYTQSP